MESEGLRGPRGTQEGLDELLKEGWKERMAIGGEPACGWAGVGKRADLHP